MIFNAYFLATEKPCSRYITARTDSNKVVNFEGPEKLIGEIVKIKIVSEHMWYLKGELERK